MADLSSLMAQRLAQMPAASDSSLGFRAMLGPLAALAQANQAAQPQDFGGNMQRSYQMIAPVVAKMRAGMPLSDEDNHALTAAALRNPLIMGATAPDMPFNPSAISRSITKQLGAKLYDKSKSGSRYYTLPDGRYLRVSNHELSDMRGTSPRHMEAIIDPDAGEVTIKHDLPGGFDSYKMTLTPDDLDVGTRHVLNSITGQPGYSYQGFAGDMDAFKQGLADAVSNAERATRPFARK